MIIHVARMPYALQVHSEPIHQYDIFVTTSQNRRHWFRLLSIKFILFQKIKNSGLCWVYLLWCLRVVSRIRDMLTSEKT